MTSAPDPVDTADVRDAAPCRLQSAAADEPMAGTAPYAVGWLALEQPGPWGRKALTESRLDPELGARIEAAAAAVDVRPVLVRRPGRAEEQVSRTVMAAHTVPGRTWLLTAQVPDPAGVAWEELAKAAALGDVDDAQRVLSGADPAPPQLLVCANGRRDVCCAIAGRPVAAAAAAEAPDRVWEATHLGGHRFAPTAAVLPSGMVHGRLDAAAAHELLAAAERHEIVLGTARGRTTWPGPAQAAELAVRRLVDERRADAVHVAATDAPGTWSVRHVDGRAWRVPVGEQVPGETRADSCGRDAVPVCSWVAGDPLPDA